MKWILGALAVLFAFALGCIVGWVAHRPHDAGIATASTSTSTTLVEPTIAAAGATAPSASATAPASWVEDTEPFSWPKKMAPPNDVLAVDDTHYLVDEAFAARLTHDPASFAATVRMVPAVEDGKTRGIKLFGVRAGSTPAKLGLMNGDRADTLNGVSLNEPDSALEAFTKTPKSKRFSLVLQRRGKPLTLHYMVTP